LVKFFLKKFLIVNNIRYLFPFPADLFMQRKSPPLLSATKHGMKFVNQSLRHGRRGSVNDDPPGKGDEAVQRVTSASLILAQTLNTVLLEGSPRADTVVLDAEGAADPAFASARTAIALRDRHADNPEELPLTEGELVAVLPRMQAMFWWTGRSARGRVGSFPIDAVLVVHPTTRFVRIGGRNVADVVRGNDDDRRGRGLPTAPGAGTSRRASVDPQQSHSAPPEVTLGDAASLARAGAGSGAGAGAGAAGPRRGSGQGSALDGGATASGHHHQQQQQQLSPHTPRRQDSDARSHSSVASTGSAAALPAYKRGSEGHMAGLSRSPSMMDAMDASRGGSGGVGSDVETAKPGATDAAKPGASDAAKPGASDAAKPSGPDLTAADATATSNPPAGSINVDSDSINVNASAKNTNTKPNANTNPPGRLSTVELQARPLPAVPVRAAIPVDDADVQPFYAVDAKRRDKEWARETAGEGGPKRTGWLRRGSKGAKDDKAALL
jgi:hypothetical protein